MSTRVESVQSISNARWWGNPAVVAGLWLFVTGLHVFDQVRFPAFSDGSPYVSSILYLSAAPVLAALLAASITRLWNRALTFAGLMLLVECLATLCWLAAEWLLDSSAFDPKYAGVGIGLVGLAASAWLVGRASRSDTTSLPRRALGVLVALLVLSAWPCISLLDGRFLAMSAQLAPAPSAEDALPDIDEERLWTSQPSLVAQALAQVAQPRRGTGTTYLVTVGAGGSQDLFGREARVARETLGRALGAEQRSVVLANDEASLYRVPLAANSNLDSVLTGLARRGDPSRDLIVLYLTSHGGREAELMTDLPNYRDLQAIGARRLAEELKRAGIRRRVIIVSACYAGSWIKPLATDDTIVIAAARADRNSFGCSDDRELTYFGEAFLKAPVPAGASFAERFEAAKRKVAKWEATEAKRPSEPQAFVGRNMTAVWNARPTEAPAIN